MAANRGGACVGYENWQMFYRVCRCAKEERESLKVGHRAKPGVYGGGKHPAALRDKVKHRATLYTNTNYFHSVHSQPNDVCHYDRSKHIQLYIFIPCIWLKIEINVDFSRFMPLAYWAMIPF
jgi:hypothetical protein